MISFCRDEEWARQRGRKILVGTSTKQAGGETEGKVSVIVAWRSGGKRIEIANKTTRRPLSLFNTFR